MMFRQLSNETELGNVLVGFYGLLVSESYKKRRPLLQRLYRYRMLQSLSRRSQIVSSFSDFGGRKTRRVSRAARCVPSRVPSRDFKIHSLNFGSVIQTNDGRRVPQTHDRVQKLSMHVHTLKHMSIPMLFNETPINYQPFVTLDSTDHLEDKTRMARTPSLVGSALLTTCPFEN
jgi:hypothetical protein